MNEHTTCSINDKGVAVLMLDSRDSSLNVLSSAFLQSFDRTLSAIQAEPGVKALAICSAKEQGFIAGANLDELEAIHSAAEAENAARKGQELFDKVAGMKVPTIAVINGHCMGGGTELSLACRFRLAAKEKASIALPEVKLGIFPGWGGTQRLPRLVSFQTALDMILTGRSYNSYRAYRCGLVDKVVPDEILNDYAVSFAEEVIRTGGRQYLAARKKKATGMIELIAAKNFAGRFLMLMIAKKQVLKRTHGNYPSPLMAIEALQKGLGKPLDEGLKIEARLFGKAVATPEHKNLLHIFRLSERPKKQTGVEADFQFEEPANIGVIGAGVMGGAIAQLLAYKDYPVVMKDIDDKMLLNGLAHADSLFEGLKKKHKLTSREKRRKMERIYGTLNYDAFKRAQLVVEAVAENMEIKKRVLMEAEYYLSPDAVFATNTSALSVTQLQSAAKHPERVCGMHFFNPVHRMPLVEVIAGEKSHDAAVAAVFDLAKKLGKVPVVVKDSPGFLVNRLLGVYINEACLLAEEGCDFQWLDSLVVKFGMPMGPFRLIDEVGIDIASEVGRTLAAAFHDRLKASGLTERMRNAGLVGKKGGKGFYIYRGGRKKMANPTAVSILGESKRENGDEAVKRMMYLMVNEAARCLSEGIVKTPHDVDTGMVFGTGFPPFRGGLLRWADTVGLNPVVLALKKFAERFGDRFFPEPMLSEKKSFY